jgi:putative FmdB family regulatory protein
MPIYEYQCAKCGTFEATQRITDRPLAKCPTCRGKVKKLISNTSFQLKGTGWYITDYARKDKDGGKDKEKVASKGENGSKPASEKSEFKKSDSSTTSSDKSSSSTSTSA